MFFCTVPRFTKQSFSHPSLNMLQLEALAFNRGKCVSGHWAAEEEHARITQCCTFSYPAHFILNTYVWQRCMSQNYNHSHSSAHCVLDKQFNVQNIQKFWKFYHDNWSEPSMTSSNWLFYLTQSLKPEGIQFTIMQNKEEEKNQRKSNWELGLCAPLHLHVLESWLVL